MTRKEAVEAVKKRLWTFGYSVQDYSDKKFVNFDLLLNEKLRMVIGRRQIKNLPKGIDIYVFVDEAGKMIFKNKNGDTKSPTKL